MYYIVLYIARFITKNTALKESVVMKKLNLVLLLSLGLISAGCSNNDTEVKALQEQLIQTRQQLNESEEKAECAFCGKEDYISNLNVRTNSECEIDYYYYYYYYHCQYVSKETK